MSLFRLTTATLFLSIDKPVLHKTFPADTVLVAGEDNYFSVLSEPEYRRPIPITTDKARPLSPLESLATTADP